ncbi:glycosyltransferase [Lachnospiraceae bacterium JLR.KK008]
MVKQITFSVVIVCLNAGQELLRTVDSVLRQSYSNYEIIVKDGMSGDGYVERLPADERLRIVRQKDKGIYDAMNQAISLTTGDYVIFLNCGDYFYDEKVLEKVNAWIATDKASTEIYYGDIYNRNVSAKVISNPHINAFACYRNVPCHQACFYSGVLMKRRRYQPQYKVRADYEHFLGCYFEDGVRPAAMRIVVASYEGGGFSETKENRKRSRREHEEIVNKYMSRRQILKYRFLMTVTLAPLRTKIAQSEKLSGIYHKAKACIYARKEG